ncbi:hypothetical protein KP77_16240 [Jeotgalibacillus alimentarius]|uniref:Uncharacterized protein n=1 Tax=Jeotgalibacillus alimentarius TaxID=135826 RepID=A0A0C2S8A2_9BACL|nr:hypothetical protein KP77_16240 [Jeotgalibacillus alimentarius]
MRPHSAKREEAHRTPCGKRSPCSGKQQPPLTELLKED